MRIFLLALICFSLIFATASAIDVVVPGDSDGDMIVSDEELELAEQSYNDGEITSDELEEIKHIHDNYPITIVDSADRELKIYKPVERVIPIVAWSYEPLYILGAEDKIVGVEKGSSNTYSYLAGIVEKPVIGTYLEPDYEKIAELEPDVVIVQPAYLKKVDEKLSPLGITVVDLPFNQQDKFDQEMRTLAKILGPQEEIRGEEFINWKQNYVDAMKKTVEGSASDVRVYGEWSDTPWYTGSKASGMDEAITTAGGINIAGVLNPEGEISKRYPTVDSEWVLKENPQVIIFAAFGDYTGYLQDDNTNAANYIDEAKLRAGLDGTDAVTNDQLYVIDGYLVEAVRGFIGANYLAKWFYPEEFEELDPEEIHREYFEEWLGVPYQGVWAYPQVS